MALSDVGDSMHSSSVPNFEVRVAGRFKMDRLIGAGSFGQIYMAKDMYSEMDVAIKFET